MQNPRVRGGWFQSPLFAVALLSLLKLSNNSFTGTLPTTMGGFTILQYVLPERWQRVPPPVDACGRVSDLRPTVAVSPSGCSSHTFPPCHAAMLVAVPYHARVGSWVQQTRSADAVSF